MAWDFETDPEFKQKLDWIDQFVREECEPLDLLFHANKHAHYETDNPLANAVIWPLQERVKRAGLWPRLWATEARADERDSGP
jgi:acyl-CoA dehydrogenase